MGRKSDFAFLSAEDVCKLLSECAKTGVTELSYAGLQVKFLAGTKEIDSPIQIPAPNEMVMAQIAEKSLAQEEQITKKDRLDMLLIEDPQEAERMMLAGELEDEEYGIEE